MNLLILGGTKFLGLHLVKEALNRGHEVTIFTRGSVDSSFLPKQVEKLFGDREGNLSALEGRKWDAVIDTSGYVPRIVKDSAQLLSKACDMYAFVSSISVYKDFSKQVDENSQVGELEDISIEAVNGETYGPLKALSENEVRNAFPEGALIIRPGLIVGPNDYTDRFTYWPVRIALGGDVVVPGNSDAAVQFIDVRDLATFILKAIEEKKIGTYNVTGPKETLSFKDFVEVCKEATQSDAEFVWVEDEFLLEQNIGFWVELPLYIPAKENMQGFLTVNIDKALSNGLLFRPLSETVLDTLNWDNTRQIKQEDRKAGLDPLKEKSVLKKWNKRNDVGQ